MFSSSKDVLFLTIAACVAIFTFFSCWGLFYLVGIIRNGFKIVKDARKIVDKTEGILDAIKDKINSSTTYLFLIGEAVKKISEIAKHWHAKQGADCDCDGEGECECGGDCDCHEEKREKPRKVKVK